MLNKYRISVIKKSDNKMYYIPEKRFLLFFYTPLREREPNTYIENGVQYRISEPQYKDIECETYEDAFKKIKRHFKINNIKKNNYTTVVYNKYYINNNDL